MGLARQVAVRCDVCSGHGPGADSSNNARRLARLAGWRTLPGGVDLCPEHTQITVAQVRALQTA